MSKQLKQLSNGQMQLALLLGLFLSQKELILLDEPFQFLDPLTKSRVNNYVLSHLNESTTLVLITHYEKDIDRWAHHRLHLDHRMGRSHPI
jgi:molybdate transport system ATP-binding protein